MNKCSLWTKTDAAAMDTVVEIADQMSVFTKDTFYLGELDNKKRKYQIVMSYEKSPTE